MIKQIFYDIESNKFRNKLSKKLQSWGLIRVQYSVFYGKHSIYKWNIIESKIDEMYETMSCETDKIYIININRNQLEQMQVLGMDFPASELLEEPITLFF